MPNGMEMKISVTFKRSEKKNHAKGPFFLPDLALPQGGQQYQSSKIGGPELIQKIPLSCCCSHKLFSGGIFGGK